MMAATGIAAMPDWLAAAMAPQDPVQQWREPQLRAAVAKARQDGKPLLVLVAPAMKDQGNGYTRGQWFGAWLNHGGAAALAPIALCTVTAASLEEVQRVTGAKAPAGSPCLLLVDVAHVGEPDAAPPKVTAMHVELGSLFPERPRDDTEAAQAERRKHVESGIARLSAELQAGLDRHGIAVATAATEVMSRLAAGQREQLAAWVAGGAAPADELVVRAAAEVRRAAGRLDGGPRQRLLDGLVAATEREVVKKRVPGARWQLPGGCGAEFEEPTAEEGKVQGMMACGMGIVTPLCERFLNFYSKGV